MTPRASSAVAAPAHRPVFPRFHALQGDALQCELHVHTRRTDGAADVEPLLALAEERGLRRVAFTEHVRRDTGWFADFAAEVRRGASVHPGLEVFAGCETKALDANGTLDVSEDVLDRCELVLGSVHRFSDGTGGFLETAALDRGAFAELEFAWAMGLLRSGRVDVLAHPGGMFARRFRADLPAPLLRRLAAEARERGVAIEINASYVQDLPRLLAILAEVDPLVSMGSDVHAPEDVGRCRDLLVASGRGSTR